MATKLKYLPVDVSALFNQPNAQAAQTLLSSVRTLFFGLPSLNPPIGVFPPSKTTAFPSPHPFVLISNPPVQQLPVSNFVSAPSEPTFLPVPLPDIVQQQPPPVQIGLCCFSNLYMPTASL
eukprot:GHVT01000730.1.p2 GENE.GHVT01000730.1~~GHVT01000730.1.p2  ORF type:complete len:121 (+),score=12.02 GHVT01000730.1:949-1311(+)